MKTENLYIFITEKIWENIDILKLITRNKD